MAVQRAYRGTFLETLMGWLSRRLLAASLIILLTTNAKSASLFWSDVGLNPQAGGGIVGRSTLDGTLATDLFSEQFSPYDVAVDPVTAEVYWTDNSDSGSIRRGKQDGTAAVTLLKNLNAFGIPGNGSLAVDSSLGFLYWTSNDTGIYRSRLDGTSVESIISANATEVVTEGVGRYIYYSDYLGQAGEYVGRIRRANPDGSLPTTIFTAPRVIYDLAVDPLHGHVYFRDAGIRRANLDGSGEAVDVVPAFPKDGIALDVAGRRIYWATSTGEGSGTIKSANFDGTGIVDVNTALYDPRGLAVGPASPPVPGDTNDDGRVDLTDLNNVRNLFGATQNPRRPIPGEAYPFDGAVDLIDLNLVRNNFGTQSFSVPEPSSAILAILAFCSIAAKSHRTRRATPAPVLSGSGGRGKTLANGLDKVSLPPPRRRHNLPIAQQRLDRPVVRPHEGGSHVVAIGRRAAQELNARSGEHGHGVIEFSRGVARGTR